MRFGILHSLLQAGDRRGESAIPFPGAHMPHDRVDLLLDPSPRRTGSIGAKSKKNSIGGGKPGLGDLQMTDLLGQITQR